MKTRFDTREFEYDGSQLRHLFGYMNYEMLGDSIVSWIGPCRVKNEFMADGEDLLAKSEIRGDKMLHFIIEKFDIDFFAGVALQRMITCLALSEIQRTSIERKFSPHLNREGDDIFYKNQKLSISIAKKFVNSVVIHFAVNIVNEGTPVSTLCLRDLELDPKEFAENLMVKIVSEVSGIQEATYKVL